MVLKKEERLGEGIPFKFSLWGRNEKVLSLPPAVNPEKTSKEEGASGSQQVRGQDPNTHCPYEVQGTLTAMTAG